MYLYINIYLVDIYVGIVSSTHAWSICTRVRTVSLELYFVRACLNLLLAIRIDRVVVVHPVYTQTSWSRTSYQIE